MSSDLEPSSAARRIPTLVQYCQRVALAHVDAISGFGEDIRYPLVKPILEGCTAEALLRLEHTTPHIVPDTPEIWRDLCYKTYPLNAGECPEDEIEEPDFWRNQFYFLRQAEARRFEEVGSKIRNQRLEAEERKREREIKLTDRLPPSKKRFGSSNSPSKSLFQKTRVAASKIQRSTYSTPILPPMLTAKSYRSPSAKMDLPPTLSTNPVTVKTVTYRRPPISEMPNGAASKSSSTSLATKSSQPSPTRQQLQLQTKPPPPQEPSVQFQSHKPVRPLKKDPMASLFMPKHRAYSQLPAR